MPDKASSVSLRASEAGLGVSGGAASLGVLQITSDLVILGGIGLVMSILAFAYDYSHQNINTPGRLAFWSALATHVAFGTIALPAGFMITYAYLTQEITVCMLSGAFASWSAVAIAKALRAGLASRLQKGDMKVWK